MAAAPKKPGPKPKPVSIVGQGFGTGRLHKMALLPDAQRQHYTTEIILGRMSMEQAGRELGVSGMSVARFITTVPDEERLAIVAQHFHDAKVRSALTNAAIVDEFGEDTDRDLKWVLRELKALLESASGDDDKVLKLGTLKELRQSLMALAELHGRLNKKMDIHLNLSESPQFVKLRSIILDVLGRHPDAKEDFLEQMRVLQVIDARVPA